MPRDEIERAIEALLRCHRREFIAICLRRLLMRREDSDYTFHVCILWFHAACGYGLVGVSRQCSAFNMVNGHSNHSCDRRSVLARYDQPFRKDEA